MILLKLRGNVSKSRLKSIIDFLKSLKVDVEVTYSTSEHSNKPISDFTLHAGLWKDRQIDASELRNKAWKSK